MPECLICHVDRATHRTYESTGRVNHEFSETGALVPLKKPEQAPPGPSLPKDPILRWLLVQKGIVTAAELEEAEKHLRASGFLLT